MSVNGKLEQFKAAVKSKSIEQALTAICPINAECKLFQLKVLAKRNNHDLAILLRGLAEMFIAHNKDLQTTIENMLAARESGLKATVTKVRYEEEIYTCLYLDFPKEG